MANNLLDLAALLQLSESLASQAAVDLETVDKRGNGDQTEVLDILLETLGGLFLEDDSVVGLVLDWGGVSLSIAPVGLGRCALRQGCSECGAYPCPWTTSSSA